MSVCDQGFSQSMAKLTTQSMMCLRHLAQYPLGCIDHALVLRYEPHQGLVHYNPCDYTPEIYSDSDWAKHKQTRRSVSSGYLFLFGCLLYSTSRSQRVLAMSSAEAEIYSATSATSDAVLMFHRIKFAVGEGTTIEVCWRWTTLLDDPSLEGLVLGESGTSVYVFFGHKQKSKKVSCN